MKRTFNGSDCRISFKEKLIKYRKIFQVIRDSRGAMDLDKNVKSYVVTIYNINLQIKEYKKRQCRTSSWKLGALKPILMLKINVILLVQFFFSQPVMHLVKKHCLWGRSKFLFQDNRQLIDLILINWACLRAMSTYN